MTFLVFKNLDGFSFYGALHFLQTDVSISIAIATCIRTNQNPNSEKCHFSLFGFYVLTRLTIAIDPVGLEILTSVS
jgi:hypothetical protein